MDWVEGGVLAHRLPFGAMVFMETLNRRFEKQDEKLAEMHGKYDEATNRLGNVESRLGNVESRLGNVESRLGNVENRLDKVEVQVKKIENRLDKIEGRLDRMEVRLDATATKAELHQAIAAQTWRMITAATALVAATYYIARNVH